MATLTAHSSTAPSAVLSPATDALEAGSLSHPGATVFTLLDPALLPQALLAPGGAIASPGTSLGITLGITLGAKPDPMGSAGLAMPVGSDYDDDEDEIFDGGDDYEDDDEAYFDEFEEGDDEDEEYVEEEDEEL